MKRSIFLMLGALTLAGLPTNGQSKIDPLSGCPIPSPGTLKRAGKLTEDQEIEYRSPVRYLIVYNEIGPTDDRRIEVMMQDRNINQRDLRTVFCWISERFPSPKALSINVHTNLATIETPDERELLDVSDNPRFSKYYGMYRRAHYHRYNSGREAIGYTISLSPYRERTIVIRDVD